MTVSSILGLILLAVVLIAIGANWRKVLAFVVSSRAEMKKVVFPSRERVLMQTQVVLVSLVITSLFLGGVDLLLNLAMEFIFK